MISLFGAFAKGFQTEARTAGRRGAGLVVAACVLVAMLSVASDLHGLSMSALDSTQRFLTP